MTHTSKFFLHFYKNGNYIFETVPLEIYKYTYEISLSLNRLFPVVYHILGKVIRIKWMYKLCVCMNLDSLHQVVDTAVFF